MKDNSFHLMIFSLVLLAAAAVIAIKTNLSIIAAAKEGYFCSKCGREFKDENHQERKIEKENR